MEADFCCAYCGETQSSAFNREHVIPRAFGAFYDESGAEVVLKNRVCSNCNGSFKKFEQRHTRESLDVFFRNKFLVKGRKPNEVKPNPYKKKSDGSWPIIVRGRPPGTSHDVYLQMDSHLGLNERTAAHFVHPKTSELMQIDLHSKLTREELIQRLNDAGYENGIDLNLHCRPGDEDWFKKLFEKENFNLAQNPQPYGIRAYVEGGYRKEDFRSVAKIGFNYILKFNEVGFSGRESCFEAVRAFIRDGVGNQFDFCNIPLLLKSQSTLEKPSHLLSVEASRENGIVAKVHLFATNSDESPLHVIRLGPSPFALNLPIPVCAHRFQIESGQKDSGKAVNLKAL
jgi:hypothetical protein